MVASPTLPLRNQNDDTACAPSQFTWCHTCAVKSQSLRSRFTTSHMSNSAAFLLLGLSVKMLRMHVSESDRKPTNKIAGALSLGCAALHGSMPTFGREPIWSQNCRFDNEFVNKMGQFGRGPREGPGWVRGGSRRDSARNGPNWSCVKQKVKAICYCWHAAKEPKSAPLRMRGEEPIYYHRFTTNCP